MRMNDGKIELTQEGTPIPSEKAPNTSVESNSQLLSAEDALRQMRQISSKDRKTREREERFSNAIRLALQDAGLVGLGFDENN